MAKDEKKENKKKKENKVTRLFSRQSPSKKMQSSQITAVGSHPAACECAWCKRSAPVQWDYLLLQIKH